MPPSKCFVICEYFYLYDDKTEAICKLTGCTNMIKGVIKANMKRRFGNIRIASERLKRLY